MNVECRMSNAECRTPTSRHPLCCHSSFGTHHSALGTSTSGQARLPPADGRGGQAIVELVVGLVAILVLVAGLLQLGRLAHAHTQAMMEARAEAGTFAMSQTYATQGPAPQYLYSWSDGPDGREHSRDDKPLYALPTDVRDEVLVHAKPEDLGGAAGDNPVTEAYDSGAVMDSFQLVHGHEESEDIPLYPVVRSLLYNAESIKLEGDVWLTWARSLE